MVSLRHYRPAEGELSRERLKAALSTAEGLLLQPRGEGELIELSDDEAVAAAVDHRADAGLTLPSRGKTARPCRGAGPAFSAFKNVQWLLSWHEARSAVMRRSALVWR